MYNNPYMQNYSHQNLNDKIDNEIARLQQMKNNNNMQPAINQTFQLAPTSNGIKFVNSIDDIQKELCVSETPFINKDYSTLWIKNAKGEIRTFALEEIIPKDEKDIIIENLQNQINALNNKIKEINTYEQYDGEYYENNNEYESEQCIKPTKTKKSTNVSSNRTSKTKSE